MDSSAIDWTKILTIAIPALGAYLAAWLTNRRERLQWLAKQKAEQENIVGGMASQLSGAWGEMTTQLRELVSRLQVETIEARTRAALAEDKADKLEQELEEVRRDYAIAMKELDQLRAKGLEERGARVRPIKRNRDGEE